MKSVFRNSIILLLFVFPFVLGYATEIKTRVSRTSLVIGDSVTLFIEIKPVQPKSTYYGPWQGNWEAPFVLLNSNAISDENQIFRWSGIFTVLDTGNFSIPSFPVSIIKGLDTTSLMTNPIPIYVSGSFLPIIQNSQTGLDTLLSPDKNPKTIPPSIWEWLFWIGTPLSLVILYIVFRKYLAYRKSLLPPPPPPPPPSPEEVFQKRISQIEEEAKWQLGDIKGFVSDLVDCIKNYIDNKFDLQTLESTTSELNDDKIVQILGENEHAILIGMFYIADEVKFAKGNIADERCRQAILDAKNIVQVWYFRVDQQNITNQQLLTDGKKLNNQGNTSVEKENSGK